MTEDKPKSPQRGRKRRKKILLGASFAMVCVALAVWAAVAIQSPPPEGPATDVKPTSAHYLGSSKIYMVSATPRYGHHPGISGVTTTTPLVQEGDSCFIINVTVRNDYSTEQPPPIDGTLETGSAVFIVTAKIYDRNGQQIDAQDVTNPYMMPIHIPQHELQYGESESLDIYLATSRRDIGSFDIVMLALGTIPIP